MSTMGKRRRREDLFPIQFPRQKNFLSWVELACLAKALGFPPDLVRRHVNEEVDREGEGITLSQLNRMIEVKLLHPPLHRSFNLHTADWNLCVMLRAIQMLQLSMFSFEELHNIRLAYATYEASDMKGLSLDQRTLLRTLKMCGCVISPKKLAHRVKHMMDGLEETGRIQLHEFFDLILWCQWDDNDLDSVKKDVLQADGKYEELYKLVDFETLLSYEDQRQARALDERYLAEEWDFGRERFGSKQMFKGEVVCTDHRLKQTHAQKTQYRQLKKAVSQSQRRVYKAHAGSIHPRPISAPILSMYKAARATPRPETSVAAVYESMRNRIHSANSRGSSRPDLSDRPVIPELVRDHTPSMITNDDMADVTLKLQNLEFDMSTLGSRCQLQKEVELKFYIPDYKPPAEHNDQDKEKKSAGPQKLHWTHQIIQTLAYPPFHLPPYHAHSCDASYPHGQLLTKRRAALRSPVMDFHKDYVIRYTSRQEAAREQRAQRPCTAPTSSTRPKTPNRCKSSSTTIRNLGRSARPMTTTIIQGVERMDLTCGPQTLQIVVEDLEKTAVGKSRAQPDHETLDNCCTEDFRSQQPWTDSFSSPSNSALLSQQAWKDSLTQEDTPYVQLKRDTSCPAPCDTTSQRSLIAAVLTS